MNPLDQPNNSPSKDSLTNYINKCIEEYNSRTSDANLEPGSRNFKRPKERTVGFKATAMTLDEFKDQLKNVMRENSNSPNGKVLEDKFGNRYSESKC